MAELKTKLTTKSVADFINSIEDEKKKTDSFILLEIFKEVTGEEPKLWGDAIIGFGNYHYKYASGREGDWFITGFSPRKQNLTLYIFMYDAQDESELLSRLGKHKTGKGCLYINKLSDIDLPVLKELICRMIKKKNC